MSSQSTIEAALDTSAGAALAVKRNGALVLAANMPVSGRESDAKLARWISEQFHSAGLTPAECGQWTVGTGPGSFSGLRVGISLVMGICAASGAGMRGISSDLALARQAAGGAASATVGVLHDARQGQLILGVYRLADGRWSMLQEPAVLEASLVAEAVAAAGIITWLASPRLTAVLPDNLRTQTAPQEMLDASLLLDVPGWPPPGGAAEREASCQPVYVRPAVFVPPRELRQA